ncbi:MULTISPECIES: hypothetical protein [Bacillus amyloliquefaciens group]|nr:MULTISPECIES: hypothetical protein [Bacillus amyloliquefaciens group]QZY10203.1 hypothetical protein K7B13_10465 [Bacillus amyloliquefaciens]QZY11113.1 hypothetical protein K7B13_15465 [Bacillus amyloliquefaciens]
MFKLFYRRYGEVNRLECQTRGEAYREANYITGYGLGCVDCITDENNVIIYDGLRNVLDVTSNRKGEVYEAEGAE